MKRGITFLTLLLLMANTVFSQEVIEKSYAYKGQELDLELKFGDEVKISSWDKNEIFVKVVYEINGGKLNEALELDIDEYSDRLSVDIDLNTRLLKNGEADDCPRENFRTRYMSDKDGYEICADIFVEVFLPKEADVFVNTVTGDVELKDVIGNIEIETVTGYIDMYWSEKDGADIRMKTVTGAVYTDLDILKKKKKGLRLISSHEISGTINSGGKRVYLETVTSDIYLRKSE